MSYYEEQENARIQSLEQFEKHYLAQYIRFLEKASLELLSVADVLNSFHLVSAFGLIVEYERLPSRSAQYKKVVKWLGWTPVEIAHKFFSTWDCPKLSFSVENCRRRASYLYWTLIVFDSEFNQTKC